MINEYIAFIFLVACAHTQSSQHNKQIILAIEHNRDNALLALPDDVLKPILAQSIDTAQRLEDSIKTALAVRSTCQSFNRLFLSSALLPTEILAASKILCNRSSFLGRKDIIKIHTLAQTNKQLRTMLKQQSFKYRWHEKYTLDEFKMNILPAIMLTGFFIVTLSPLAFFNTIKKRINIAALARSPQPILLPQLINLIHTSNQLELLQLIPHFTPEASYSIGEHLIMNAPFILPLMAPGLTNTNQPYSSIVKDILFYGIPAAIAFRLIACSIPIDIFDNYGSTMCTGILCGATLLCAIIRSYTVRHWKEVPIKWDTIIHDLENDKVVISYTSTT